MDRFIQRRSFDDLPYIWKWKAEVSASKAAKLIVPPLSF